MPFNPGEFFNNYNQFSPLYSANPEQNSQRLKELNDALAYVQGNPNLPNYDHLLGELQKDIAEEQNVYNATKTPTSENQAKAIEGIRLGTPDYQGMLGQMKDYLQKQIQLATPNLLNDAYQSNYNLKNGINLKAAEAGLMRSGAREKGLAQSDAGAVKGVTKAFGGLQDEASKELSREKQNLSEQELQRQEAENRMKETAGSNAYNKATGKYENAFNANTQAQLGTELTEAEEKLQKAQQGDFLSGILPGAASLAGTLIAGPAGGAVGGGLGSALFG